MITLKLPETSPRPTLLQPYHKVQPDGVGGSDDAYGMSAFAEGRSGAVSGPSRGRRAPWRKGKDLTRQDLLHAAEHLRNVSLQYGQHEDAARQMAFERVDKAMKHARERRQQEQALIDEAIRHIGPAPTDNAIALAAWRRELFVMVTALRMGWGYGAGEE
jgi:hypothetical protein